MKRENYIITVKSIYIRNAEMFCPESMTEQEILNLDDIDIFQSCEFERYWKNAEVSAYLCQMACAEEELKRELQKIAEYFKIPACFLEAIPVKKDLEDDIFHNNGEKENEEKHYLKRYLLWKPVLRINNIWNFADKTI